MTKTFNHVVFMYIYFEQRTRHVYIYNVVWTTRHFVGGPTWIGKRQSFENRFLFMSNYTYRSPYSKHLYIDFYSQLSQI